MNEDTLWLARSALKKYPNVTVVTESGERLIGRLIQENHCGEFPLFYLDSHWRDYWPLKDEVRKIVKGCPRAVVIVDDFQVPNREQFKYMARRRISGGRYVELDIHGRDQPLALSGGRASTTDGDDANVEVCGLDLLQPLLDANCFYDFLFPNYSAADAYPEGSDHPLTGYMVLFQNLENPSRAVLSDEFVHRYFTHR